MRQINLVPYDVILLEELYRRFRWWMAVLAGVCMLMCLFLVIQNTVIATIDHEVRQLEKRNVILKKRFEEIKKLQQKKSELAQKAGIVRALLATRNFSQFFIEVEQSLPPSLRLTSLELDKKNLLLNNNEGEWVDTGYFVVKKNPPGTEAKQDASSLAPNLIIKGVTLSHDDLAYFIDALERLPRFHNVNLRQCREGKKEKNKIEFELDAQVTQ